MSRFLPSGSIEEMDITWLTDRLAVGGGIWNDENMAALVRLGVTHIINMQIEFDDRPLAQTQKATQAAVLRTRNDATPAASRDRVAIAGQQPTRPST